MRKIPILSAAALVALSFPAFALDLGGWPDRLAQGWERVVQALPDGASLEAWAEGMVPVFSAWLIIVAVLLASWIGLAGRRAAMARKAGTATDLNSRWRALGGYGLAALGPILLALIAVIVWAALTTPSAARIEALQLILSPIVAGAIAMAIVTCAFTLLAAHGRRAERETTRHLPPQIGFITGLLVFAASLRVLRPGLDPLLADMLALAAETSAALIAWRATGQQRLTLRHLLRGESQTPDADPPTLPERLTGAVADRWHVLSYLFILLSLASRYGIFGPERRVGMVSDLAGSLLLLILAGVGVLLAEKLHGHILSRMNVTTDAGLRDRLALRLGRVLRTGVQIAIALWAGASIVTLWEPGWQLETGQGALMRAVATTLLALYALWFIWTLVDAVLDWSAAQSVGRGTRMRTLLPFLRNFAFVVVATLAAMSVLSNLGVDVAPLLAGAGVVGIAIGIGAQKLVGDVITGIFIIFEDSIAVGETVEAAGKTGVIEGLTIRTLRLRDGDGALHSIPFSSISTLKNNSRGYSAYTVSVTILHPEDTDRALAEIGRIGREIAEDPDWAASVTGPFSLWGVDGVSPNGVVIKGNIRTPPNAQWGLGREINRRIALRFAELGIAQVQPATGWTGAETKPS